MRRPFVLLYEGYYYARRTGCFIPSRRASRTSFFKSFFSVFMAALSAAAAVVLPAFKAAFSAALSALMLVMVALTCFSSVFLTSLSANLTGWATPSAFQCFLRRLLYPAYPLLQQQGRFARR